MEPGSVFCGNVLQIDSPVVKFICQLTEHTQIPLNTAVSRCIASFVPPIQGRYWGFEQVESASQNLQKGKWFYCRRRGQSFLFESFKPMDKTAGYLCSLKLPFTKFEGSKSLEQVKMRHLDHFVRPIPFHYTCRVIKIGSGGLVIGMKENGEKKQLYMNPDFTNSHGKNLGERFYWMWDQVQHSRTRKLMVEVVEVGMNSWMVTRVITSWGLL